MWLWVIIEPTHKEILAANISKYRNTFVAERFLSLLLNRCGLQSVSSDGSTWYQQGCRSLKLNHHIHTFFEKSLIERKIQ